MMKLDQYEPLGNDILLRVRQVNKTPKGIILPQAEQDRVMQVVKVGSLVEKPIVPGCWVLIGPGGQGVDIPFDTKDGERVICVQASVHFVIGVYDKDEENEDIVFIAREEGRSQHEAAPGPSNIIDNPGIDKAPFLKDNGLLN